MFRQIYSTYKLPISYLHRFSEFAAFNSTVRELGLGKNIAIKLNRGSCMCHRLERYNIDTDKQPELEIPLILTGADKLISSISNLYQISQI